MTRPNPYAYHPPVLYVEQVLRWADAFHDRHRRWPMLRDGAIAGTADEKWLRVDVALRLGLRGLPGGSSLARLLDERRGVRNGKRLPRLTHQQILAWADTHYRRTGQWPNETSGSVTESPRESWHAIDRALRAGVRGFRGGVSLVQLLARHRGVRNIHQLPRLTVKQILDWADRHHASTGRWPDYRYAGPVIGTAGETWKGIQAALSNGRRGLPGGSSLPRLFAKHRGIPNPMAKPRLTIKDILAWADEHRRRTGKWATKNSGMIAAAPTEKWSAVGMALLEGVRGLPGGSSLPRLLAKHRGKRHPMELPRLTIKGILAWADEHRRRTGKWPTHESGMIASAPSEKWSTVNWALGKGTRGLPGGSSLALLLDKYRRRTRGTS